MTARLGAQPAAPSDTWLTGVLHRQGALESGAGFSWSRE
jgi:hypothetical protein